MNKSINKLRSDNSFKNNIINYNQYIRLLKEHSNSILIDVRNPQEYYNNHLPSAINVPLYDLKKTTNVLLKDKKQYIFVYCKTGMRSSKAVNLLLNLGYTNVYNLIDVI